MGGRFKGAFNFPSKCFVSIPVYFFHVFFSSVTCVLMAARFSKGRCLRPNFPRLKLLYLDPVHSSQQTHHDEARGGWPVVAAPTATAVYRVPAPPKPTFVCIFWGKWRARKYILILNAYMACTINSTEKYLFCCVCW